MTDNSLSAGGHASSRLTRDQLLRAYRQMKIIREFEERLHLEIQTGAIPGFTHLYAGQEAIAVGLCEQLTDEDYIASTHRGHGHCIAKGCDVIGMMKEIYGRRDGLCKGKGGSMHIADFDKGMLGANAIVGGGPPLAVGAAIATKLKGKQRVTASFTGDGGSNQGTVFEAMNLAVVLKLPTIFVFENNGYSEHTGADYAVGSKDIAGRARGFGMPASKVDGSDFFAVYDAMAEAIGRARRGEGPSAVECMITRYYGHFEGDPQLYRAKDEVAGFRESLDCLKKFRAAVTGTGASVGDLVSAERSAGAAASAQHGITAAELDATDAAVMALIEQAVTDSKAAPAPVEADVLTDVYISY